MKIHSARRGFLSIFVFDVVGIESRGREVGVEVRNRESGNPVHPSSAERETL